MAEEKIELFMEPLVKAVVYGEEFDAPTLEEMAETALVTAVSTVSLEGASILSAGKSSEAQGTVAKEFLRDGSDEFNGMYPIKDVEDIRKPDFMDEFSWYGAQEKAKGITDPLQRSVTLYQLEKSHPGNVRAAEKIQEETGRTVIFDSEMGAERLATIDRDGVIHLSAQHGNGENLLWETADALKILEANKPRQRKHLLMKAREAVERCVQDFTDNMRQMGNVWDRAMMMGGPRLAYSNGMTEPFGMSTPNDITGPRFMTLDTDGPSPNNGSSAPNFSVDPGKDLSPFDPIPLDSLDKALNGGYNHTNDSGKADDLPDIAEFVIPDVMIRDGSHLQKGKLKPSVTYQTGKWEYLYQTNEKGLICRVHVDTLQGKKHEGRMHHNSHTYEKMSTDEASHLIADRFGGSGKLDNLVSQLKDVNRKNFLDMERQWAAALKGKKHVSVDMEITYAEGSTRPTGFIVVYKINKKVFRNKFNN